MEKGSVAASLPPSSTTSSPTPTPTPPCPAASRFPHPQPEEKQISFSIGQGRSPGHVHPPQLQWGRGSEGDAGFTVNAGPSFYK